MAGVVVILRRVLVRESNDRNFWKNLSNSTGLDHVLSWNRKKGPGPVVMGGEACSEGRRFD